MTSSNIDIVRALSETSYLEELPEALLREEAARQPWFMVWRFLLARRTHLLQPENETADLQRAALAAPGRARFKAWMEGQLDRATSRVDEEVAEQSASVEGPTAEDRPKEPSALMEEVQPVVVAEPTPPASDVPETADLVKEPFVEPFVRSFSDWLQQFPMRPPASTEAVQPAVLENQRAAEAAERSMTDLRSLSEGLPEALVWTEEELPDVLAGPSAGPLPMREMIERQRNLRKERSGSASGEKPSEPDITLSEQKEDLPSPSTEKGPTAGQWDRPVTETYAQILLAQGKWSEALTVYELLRLRYPEKSGFFALRIREIQAKHNS